jgi:hypothetical protein
VNFTRQNNEAPVMLLHFTLSRRFNFPLGRSWPDKAVAPMKKKKKKITKLVHEKVSPENPGF